MSIAGYFKRFSPRLELMEAMFERLGANAWFARNAHGPEVLRRATVRCGTCDSTKACSQWLDANPVAQEAPAFCRNHDLLERIRRDLPAAAR